jgi:hypothetical protein
LLLEFLQQSGRLTDRKLQLFACACCQRVATLLDSEPVRQTLRTIEDLSDKALVQSEWRDVVAQLRTATNSIAPSSPFSRCAADGIRSAIDMVHDERQFLFLPGLGGLSDAVAWRLVPGAVADGIGGSSEDFRWRTAALEETMAQGMLLRHIFGSPHRPLPPRPGAITPLAEEIYAGAWSRMPLLGEWLQEHGYWHEGNHCLDPRVQHVKGCWVVDWVTGRE